MHNEERLHHLNEAQWAQIEAAFLQRRSRSGFEQKISHRTAFEAVLYRERTGCPWRDLPPAYGDDHTIYMRWQRWVEKRRAPAGHGHLVSGGGQTRGTRPELGADRLDGGVRPSARRRGTKKKGGQALGRSRGGLSTKIHSVAVSEFQVLGVIPSGGQAGDAPVSEEMLAEVLAREEVKAVGGDRAYDSDAIRRLTAAAGKEAVIPPRANRVDPPDYDKEKYKGRNKAERLLLQAQGLPRRGDPLRQACGHVPRRCTRCLAGG